MDGWLLSFFIGAILSLFLPIVPALFYLFILIFCAIALFAYSPSRIASGLFFACAWMLFNGYQYDNTWAVNSLDPAQLSTQSLAVVGEVVNLPQNQNLKNKPIYRFNFKVSQLNNVVLKRPFLIRLRWDMHRQQSSFILSQGQVLNLLVKIKPAHGIANVGGFSYQTWLRQKQIVATGYVKQSEKNKVLSTHNNIRKTLYEHYNQHKPLHELSPLLLALSFGERSEITPSLWQVLQATGTQHLIAISGLHLGLVASGSFVFVLVLMRFLPLSSILSGRWQQKIQSVNIRYIALAISFFTHLFLRLLSRLFITNNSRIGNVRALLVYAACSY